MNGGLVTEKRYPRLSLAIRGNSVVCFRARRLPIGA